MTLSPSPHIYTCSVRNLVTYYAARIMGHLAEDHQLLVAPMKNGRLTDTKELLIDHIDRLLSDEDSTRSAI